MRQVGHHNLLPAERHGRIVETLGRQRAVRVSVLSRELGVSEMTIRRDLEHLEAKGFCSRTHGGAILKLRLDKEPLYANNELTHTTEKERIARAAAAMILPGETVFLSAGTTTAQMLRHIDPNLEVRIVTHNAGAIAEPHARGMELIVLGGQYYAQMHAFQGTMPVESVRRFFASKMFLGVDGVSLQEGLTTPSIGLADVDRAMIGQTVGKMIVLADSSKIGVVGDVAICPLDQADIIIIDDGVDEEVREDMRRRGIEVVVV
jgi:DeoR/GlpR family transcriptional regulator of sugar metabolism